MNLEGSSHAFRRRNLHWEIPDREKKKGRKEGMSEGRNEERSKEIKDIYRKR